MYENDNIDNNSIGNSYIFKIPAEIIYDLIVCYGGYAHGTCNKLGEITHANLKGRNCEYALRCDPNVKKGKNFKLWNEFMKYKVEYHCDNF